MKTKPKSYKKKLMDYHDMVRYVEEKYKVDIRDYGSRLINGKNTISYNCDHEQEWKVKNITDWTKYYDPKIGATEEGKKFWETQEGNIYLNNVRKSYENSPDGKCKEIPYLDFWHFMLDRYFPNVSNGCIEYLNWADVKEMAEEDWQKEICDLFIKEFGDKEYEVEIKW